MVINCVKLIIGQETCVGVPYNDHLAILHYIGVVALMDDIEYKVSLLFSSPSWDFACAHLAKVLMHHGPCILFCKKHQEWCGIKPRSNEYLVVVHDLKKTTKKK